MINPFSRSRWDAKCLAMAYHTLECEPCLRAVEEYKATKKCRLEILCPDGRRMMADIISEGNLA